MISTGPSEFNALVESRLQEVKQNMLKQLDETKRRLQQVERENSAHIEAKRALEDEVASLKAQLGSVRSGSV